MLLNIDCTKKYRPGEGGSVLVRQHNTREKL